MARFGPLPLDNAEIAERCLHCFKQSDFQEVEDMGNRLYLKIWERQQCVRNRIDLALFFSLVEAYVNDKSNGHAKIEDQ